LVSNWYFMDSVWLPNSKAKVDDEEAQLQISVKRCSEIRSCACRQIACRYEAQFNNYKKEKKTLFFVLYRRIPS
jgi:hypothetical protein